MFKSRAVHKGKIMTITEMVYSANSIARKNGFNISQSNKESFNDLMKHIKSELKELKRSEKPWEIRDCGEYNPDSYEAELADIVIRIASYCGHQHINLEDEILKKMDYNSKRKYH